MKISKGRSLSILQKLFFLFLISVKWQNIRKNNFRFPVFIFSSVAYGVSAQEEVIVIQKEKENFEEDSSRNVPQLSSPKEIFDNLIFTVCQGAYYIFYFYFIVIFIFILILLFYHLNHYYYFLFLLFFFSFSFFDF